MIEITAEEFRRRAVNPEKPDYAEADGFGTGFKESYSYHDAEGKQLKICKNRTFTTHPYITTYYAES